MQVNYMIMGPSGSGKSTLINILGFIDREYHGEYLFEGSNYQTQSDNQLANIRNKTVGFVFQNFKPIHNNTYFRKYKYAIGIYKYEYDRTKE